MELSRRAALCLPLALSACGRQSAPLRHPFREANDHLVTPVIFDGREGLALIDNGAPMTSLDRAFAEAAGLRRAAAGGGLAPLSMRLGEADVRIHPFLEDLYEAAIAADAPVTAIAGMELFEAFAVAFDFSAGLITLAPRPFRPPEDAVPIRLDEGAPPHPGVSVSINGTPAKAYLDLGCSSALLVSPALAEALRLLGRRPVSTRQVILSGETALGLSVARRTSIETLALAGHAFADVPIDVMPNDARPFSGIDAVIGVPLLRKFDFTLDLPGRLHLAPNANYAQPFARRMTGLQTKPEGEYLLVRHVAAGSPAEAAGFSEGDLIAAIEGAPPLMRTLRDAAGGQVLDIRLADGRRRRIEGRRYY